MQHENMYAGIVDRVLDHAIPTEACTTLYATDETVVYKLEMPEPLVIRVSSSESVVQQDILDAIAAEDGLTAKILFSDCRDIEDEMRAIQVMTFLPGAPLDRYPSASKSSAIIRAVHTLHTRLRSVSDQFRQREIPHLLPITQGLIEVSEEGPMKDEALKLVANPRFCTLMAENDPCLIYGDPWPLNLLIEPMGDGYRVRIADIDPLLFGPAILQPAMLFSACFVVVSLLYPDSQEDPATLDALIAAWPDPIDRQDILLMMRVYPILLSLQKAYQFKQQPSADSKSLDVNLSLLKRCLDRITAWAK